MAVISISDIDADEWGSGELADKIGFDPRAMAEKFTASGAEGMLQHARAAFGIVFDDKSEIDIYKVWIGPPGENHLGFFNNEMKFTYALRAEQTSWATQIEEAAAFLAGDEDWEYYDAAVASHTRAENILGTWTRTGDAPTDMQYIANAKWSPAPGP